MADAFEKSTDVLSGDVLADLVRARVPIQIIQNRYENCTVVKPEGGSMGKKSTDVSGVGNAVGGDGSSVTGANFDRSQIAVGSESKKDRNAIAWASLTAIIVAMIGAAGKIAYDVYHHDMPAAVSAPAPTAVPPSPVSPSIAPAPAQVPPPTQEAAP